MTSDYFVDKLIDSAFPELPAAAAMSQLIKDGKNSTVGDLEWLESKNADGVCGLDGCKVRHAPHRYRRSLCVRPHRADRRIRSPRIEIDACF